jgi:hypothetical protein
LNAKFLRNGIVMLVLVAGTVALLLTWVSSSAPAETTGYSTFLADVKAGNVTTVVQDGETLTVTVKDPAKPPYTVVVQNSITGEVLADMQKAAVEGGVTLPSDVYARKPTADTSWVGLLLTGSAASSSS